MPVGTWFDFIGITNSYAVATAIFCPNFLQRHRSPPAEERKASIRKQLSDLVPCIVFRLAGNKVLIANQSIIQQWSQRLRWEGVIS